MDAENLKLLAALAQSLVIFAGGVFMFILAVVIKALIRKPALKAAKAYAAGAADAASDAAGRAKAEHAKAFADEKWNDAKFDNFRVGVDLMLLSLSTYLAVVELSWERIGGTYLVNLNALLIILQLLLLIIIIWLMASFYDSSKRPLSWMWFWGVYVPLVLGGFSILFNVAFVMAVYVG
jgi:hypothetical protein